MGILDRLLRRKKKGEDEKDVKYILKRRGESGGMEKVAELQEPTPIENLYKTLTPGIYSLHKYKKGQTGFDVVWGPVEVLGEAEEKTGGTSGVRKSPFAAMKEQLEGFKEIKDDMKEMGALFTDLFAEKKVSMEDAMGYFDTLKKHKDSLDALFPGATTKSNEIPLSGTIPAWMAFVPQVIDQSADALEKRLVRWGLVEGVGTPAMGTGEDPIRLPERPKVIEKEKEKEKPKAGDKEIMIDLPKKPVVEEVKKGEVREAEIKEEKEEGEDKDGGEGTE